MKERIRVYHKDGSLLNDMEGNAVELSAVEMTDGWMEDCFVQTTIESAYPINFSIGDYIVYRGERYELNYDPGKAKTARAGSDRGAFRYENVKLNALQDELVRAQFLDVVLGMENTEEQTIPYTALPKFGFYVQTVDDLLDRIQANMDEQMGAGLWALYSRNKERSLQRGCDGTVWEEMYGEGTTETIIDSAALTIDNQNCWNALALVNSKWDINFVVRGRNVFVDTTGLEVPYEFVYGKRRGLYEITQTADDSQAVTTRLRAYGSEKNLPTHYYANLCVDVFGETSKISHLASSTNAVLHITIPSLSWAAAGSYFTSVRDGSTAESREYNVTVKSGDIEGRGYAVSSARKEGEGTVTIILNSSNDEYGMTMNDVEDFYTAVMKERKVYFLQGVNKQSFPSKNMIANTDQMPSHMAVTRLMLPGFPKMSVKEWWDTQATEEEKAWINPSGKEHLLSELKNRPYVDSVNIKELGVRNGSVMFDTENKKEGIIEIYPTIEEMTVDGQRIDELNSGSAIKDNGIFKDGQTVPPFSVTLSPKVNFDINMLKKEDFTISMKDGKCGGREFKVNGSVKENGVWKLTLDRVKDDALELYFPNKDFQMESGDHFVLTGIEMPDSYVEAASAKLLKYALAWLDKNDYTRYVFEPKVDEIFMAYQHDKAKADTTGKTASLYETLKAGSLLHFSDTDLKIDKSGVIERLIIREELGSIPTYDVTIKEDKDVGALQKMQDAIDTVTMSVKSGLSSAQIEGLIRSRGAKHFLSKTDSDTAQDVIRFLRGLTIGRTGDGYGVTGEGAATLSSCVVESVRNAEATDEDRTIVGGKGFDLYMGKDGKSHLYIDYLTTRTKFFAASAEIRKVSYSGGTTLFSNAGSTIMKVAHVLDDAGVTVGYKCYAAADDGTTRTANWWHVGMMALCQTFNVKAGESENLANRYYWRLVVGTGQETLEDGKLYDYVILSNKRTFMGSEACVPVTSQKVIGADGKALVFGDVMIQVTTTGEKQSLAAVFEEQEGKTTDDGNNVIANRMFFGYEPSADGGEPDAPQPYDVIVQAGDQIQWNRFGNLIKLTTSTEDGSDNGNAPAIAMYHAMGAPYKTGDTVNPYQWKTLTSLDSPLLVLKNAKNFKFFTDDNPDNIIDPVTVTYDLVPSSEYIIRKPNSQTATPNDITFTLRKRTGNVTEDMKDGYVLTADYTTTAGESKSGVVINRLSDIGVSFYLLASVTVRATVKADNTTVTLTLPILSDGAKGDTGTSFKVLGYALAHAKTYAELQQITPTEDGLYLVDDTTGMEGGSKRPCVVQWKNGKYIVCDSNDGDSYKIGEILWTNTGTYWLDIGSVKGEGVVISDMSVTYAISDSATVTPTEWQSAIIAATDAKPYLWTRTTVTYKDSEGEHTTVSYAIAYKGKDGDKGDPGANGKDAVEFILKNAPLVFDTDEKGVVSASVSKTATIQVMRSSKNITSEVGNLFPSNSNVGCGKPTLTKQTDGIDVTISGASINKDSTLGVSVTSGYVIVYMAIGSTLYSRQIPFMVNLAKFTGTISADNKKLRTDYTELTNRVGAVETDVNGIPIKTQEKLTEYTSTIEQTAREISLKVSTAVVERRNLLPGSAFRKQNEGCGFMKAKILCSQKFEGTNIALADKPQAGGLCWGGGYSRNIHVTKGKRYTLTFMARVLSGSADVLCEIRWEKSATDGSHPAGYAGPAGRANLGVEKIQSAEGWHLYQRSFTVPANAAYEWVAVWCIKSNSSTANQQVCFALPILIEGDAKDYVCWGLSPDDYNYIGGNLLDNTRTFTKGGNLTRMDASVVSNVSYNNGCSVIYANAASKFIEMAQWSVAPFIKKDEDYMFSFVAKGSGTLSVFMWNGSNLSIFAEDSESATTKTDVDGARSFNLTSDWKRYWVHWRSEGTGLPNYALIRCVQGSKAWVTIPKLEVGATPTDWIEGKSGYVEDSGLVAKILRTGFDIENGKITATAGTFEVQDNRGNTTARITDDGFFTGSVYATNGYFDGLIRKLKRVITKENFYEYFEKDTYSGMSDAYNPIWDKIGSNFVIQSTPEDADGVAMYLQLALPTAYPITHPYTDGRYERAREVIGNTIIIRCENGNGITLYGTSRTAPNWDSGGVASSPYTLKSGYVAYLTCKVKNTGSSSEESGYETIYWERVVRKALP
jgi:hypothetical protein|nr:MAG TPA: hypothetical protein [Caudoviricetes sp.]